MGKERKGRKRIRSRRALLARISTLIVVLGLLCLLFAAGMAVYGYLRGATARAAQLRLASIYFACGAGLLLLNTVMVWFRKRMMKPRASRRPPVPATSSPKAGAVLLLTLVVLALMAALLLHIQMNAVAQRRLAEASLAQSRLTMAAEDAIRSALRLLLDDLTAGPTAATNALWAAPVEFTTPDGIATRVRIADEQARFDLNNAVFAPEGERRGGNDITMDLLTLCGDFTPVDKVDALRDWIDEDTDGFRESSFYQQQADGYTTPNRPLLSLHEVLWVHGFDRDLFRPRDPATAAQAFRANFSEQATVLPVPHPGPVPVNVNSASREVLLAVLGLAEEAAVDELLVYRMAKPVTSMEALAALLEPQLMSRSRAYLTTASQYFRLDARAYQDGRGAEVQALVQRHAAGYVSVLQWVL